MIMFYFSPVKCSVFFFPRLKMKVFVLWMIVVVPAHASETFRDLVAPVAAQDFPAGHQ